VRVLSHFTKDIGFNTNPIKTDFILPIKMARHSFMIRAAAWYGSRSFRKEGPEVVFFLAVLLYFGPQNKLGGVNAFFAAVTAGIWFAAVYAGHHYVIDVGAACALADAAPGGPLHEA
jgi:hypothetical protein